jgi:beta-N-acetylhexosaminidase
VDSHLSLPRIEANDLDADLLPFALNTDLPWAMSAHIVYPAWDPALPATLSPTVIEAIIRRRIGFEGVLVTDDLAMKALSGTPADLARQAVAAGCDIALYCSGELAPTADLLERGLELTDLATTRLAAAQALATGRRMPLDEAALAAERDRLLA